MNVTFVATLWRWEARTEDWYFATVPAVIGGDIAEIPRMKRGFGAVRVEAAIGQTRWRTSIFPQREDAGGGVEYSLPVKRAVREAEGLSLGEEFLVTLTVLDG